jgi:hypothetical protein
MSKNNTMFEKSSNVEEQKKNGVSPVDDQGEAVHETKNEKLGQDQTSLRDGVTVEPRSDEEMHLGLILESPPLVDVYLKVSDDTGQMLGDEDLEREVKRYCELYETSKRESIDDPDRVLQELKDLSVRYSKQINKAFSISDGTITKYRLRLGRLFNFQKKLVKMKGDNWIDWFKTEYDEKSLRNIQEYMKIAKIPGVERYAVFGIERLKELGRAIELKSGEDDLISDFLKAHHVLYDPESDDPIDGFKLEIDSAISMAKIKKVEQDKNIELGVDYELVKKLFRMRIPVDTGIIRDMVILKEARSDVNEYLERRYINGGAEASIITGTKKVRGLPKLVAEIKSTVEYMKEHTDLVDQIDAAQIETLEAQVSEFKTLINNS